MTMMMRTTTMTMMTSKLAEMVSVPLSAVSRVQFATIGGPKGCQVCVQRLEFLLSWPVGS